MGLHLDPRTIVFLNFIGAILISVGILSLSKSYFSHIRSLRYWSYATLLQALGWVLVALRNIIPDFFSIVMANVLLLSSLALYFNILAIFKHIRIKIWWSFVPVLFAFITLSYFTYFSPDIAIRIVCVSAISAIMMSLSSYILLYNWKKEKKYAHRFTGLLFGYCGSILLIRTVSTAYLGPNKDEYLLESNLVNDLLYTSYFINSIFISFGFILMCTDWYLEKKKQSQKELIDSKKLLEETNQIARIGNWEINLDTQKIFWSKVIREIHEVPADFIPTVENAITFYKEGKDRDTITEAVNKAFLTPYTFDVTLEIITSEGNRKWVRSLGKSEFSDGKCKRILGIFQDITEHKISEEKLEQSEEKYRQMIETAEEGIWLFDKNSRTIFVNKKLCEMLEYTSEEMLGTKGLDFTNEEGRHRCHLALHNIKAGCKEKFEIILRKKCGEWMWARLSLCSLLETDGTYKGALAMVTDITENHHAGELIRKSEEKYRNLFNNNPMPIFIWRLDDYKIIEVNKAAIREYGYSRNEFLRKHITDIWTEQERQKAVGFSQEILNSDKRISRICKHQNRFAQEILMNLSCLQITYNDQPCVLAMAENVTQKLQIANQLQESYDKIRLLNNHLQSIREEERIHIAREIHDELGQQLTILKMDLAYFGKTETLQPLNQLGQVEQIIGKVDTAIQTVRKIATELRPGILDDLGLSAALEWQAEEFRRNTEIQCHFKNNLTQEETFTTPINTAFFRIFQEAMTNVARHANATSVSVQLSRNDNLLILQIHDNGIGIPEKQKKHSLGILGMKERAAMLGGEFSISSIQGQGTNLIVKIPLK